MLLRPFPFLTVLLASQPRPAPHRHQGIGENPEEAEERKVGIQDAEQELTRTLAVEEVECIEHGHDPDRN